MNIELKTRAYLRFVVWLNRKAKSAAVRLTHLTGKSNVLLHPKHLVAGGENQAWYLRHIKPGVRVLDVGSSNSIRRGPRHATSEFTCGSRTYGAMCQLRQAPWARLHT